MHILLRSAPHLLRCRRPKNASRSRQREFRWLTAFALFHFVFANEICVGVAAAAEGSTIKESSAQSKKNLSAKDAFEAGRTAYDDGHYETAAGFFAKSHALSKKPELLYNVGQAYRLAGQYQQAAAAYRSFIREAPNSVNRADAERKLELVEILALKPPDKTELQRQRELHELLLSHAVEFDAAPPPSIVTTTAPTPVANRHIPEWLPWVGVGATGVLFAGAVATGVNARDKYRFLRDTCGASGACTDAQIASVNSSANWATAFWILTGLAAVGTGAAFYIDVQDRQNATVTVAGRF